MCGVTGRPFWVQGENRLAFVEPRSDWLAVATEPMTIGLSAKAREHLASAWAEIGRMEHASVAAFARFTLQLLSLGAPADLVARSGAAMADETEHAKLAFALASTYRGEQLGPTRIDIDGVLDAQSIEDVIATAVREGCVGETIAAIEAAEACEHASDPAARSALSRIAQDETRHAELSWRFVAWAVTRGGERARLVAWRELERAFAEEVEAQPDASEPDERVLLNHGILPPRLREHVRRTALATAVRPCAAALLRSVSLDAAHPAASST
jgi:hypothetical protein